MYLYAEDLLAQLALTTGVENGTYTVTGGWVGNQRTFHVEKVTGLTSGFEVGIRPVQRRVNEDDFATNAPFLALGESIRFGIWKDDNGGTHVDEVVHVEQEELAVALANQYDQEAYWGWRAEEVVNL